MNGFDSLDVLPGGPGAYGLVICLGRRLRPQIAALGAVELAAGRYLYAGSAYGPGGIRARVRRHLKAAKAVRWHVDSLTNAFGVALVVALPGGCECGLVSGVGDWPGTTVPAPGFGATDCRVCPAHLLRLGAGTTLGDFEAPSVLAGLGKASGATSAIAWRPGEAT